LEKRGEDREREEDKLFRWCNSEKSSIFHAKEPLAGFLTIESNSHFPVGLRTKISAPKARQSLTRYPLEASLDVSRESN
jgi:hypothetical protein